jgi:bisphosphoglycerate-dependent phosphoglycerate mutase
MSPEAQRIAIAEACGWTCCGQVPGLQPHGLPPWLKIGDYTTQQVLNHEVPVDTLPDYLNSLNAMAEAEKLKDRDLRIAEKSYKTNLCEVCYREWPLNKDPIHATAAQRAEAFLKTLNLWTP